MDDHDSKSLETEKICLEIALLRKQLNRSPFFEILIDKWGPAIIAAIVLFTLVPLANYIIWRNQKSIEISNIHLAKRIEVYAELSTNGTRFSQLISLIKKCHDVNKIKNKEIKDGESNTDKALANIPISDLVMERLDVESRLVKSLREVKIYFGPDASTKVDSIRAFYNQYADRSFDENFISEFLKKYYELLSSIETEIWKELRI